MPDQAIARCITDCPAGRKTRDQFLGQVGGFEKLVTDLNWAGAISQLRTN
tara:strand:+ start:849 stop:998 length:150 start_codon:yes stop_codon:yes gene_type:complete